MVVLRNRLLKPIVQIPCCKPELTTSSINAMNRLAIVNQLDNVLMDNPCHVTLSLTWLPNYGTFTMAAPH
jgi:hypothetical protein